MINLNNYKHTFSKTVLKKSDRISFLFFLKDLVQLILFTYLLALAENPFIIIFLWVLLALTYLGMYSFGHDAAHYSLFKYKNLNYIFGQIAFLPTLHPFHQWVFGHNQIHHPFTSQLKKDLAWHPRSVSKYKKMKTFQRVIHKFFWSIYGIGFYYLVKMWLQGLILNPAPNNKAKIDIFIVGSSLFIFLFLLIYYSNLSLLNGLIFFGKIYAIPFILANYLMAFVTYVNHINSNLKWKTQNEWNEVNAQLFGSTNYSTNIIWNFFAHNILIHSPHHIHQGIPFYNLPKALDELKQKYGDDIIIREKPFIDLIHSTSKCKLVDENGNWKGYPK